MINGFVCVITASHVYEFVHLYVCECVFVLYVTLHRTIAVFYQHRFSASSVCLNKRAQVQFGYLRFSEQKLFCRSEKQTPIQTGSFDDDQNNEIAKNKRRKSRYKTIDKLYIIAC